MHPSIEDLIDLARGAGEILREGYGKRHQIDRKGRIDLVTEVDHASETYLVSQIQARFPEHTIDTEESGLLSGIDHACWYIDPLDGTTNYAHDIPVFSVSVAFATAGKIQLGVVYNPMLDECFSAELGKGAQLNGQPLHVSQAQTLNDSLLVTGFAYDAAFADRNLAFFGHFTHVSQGVRRMGSAALDLCYVAAGRFDGYWELTLRPWDFAAGVLIVAEAGGQVTNINGNADLFQTPYSILAGNPVIQPKMLAEFKLLQA